MLRAKENLEPTCESSMGVFYNGSHFLIAVEVLGLLWEAEDAGDKLYEIEPKIERSLSLSEVKKKSRLDDFGELEKPRWLECTELRESGKT